MAKEFSICAICGVVVANDEMHDSYHAWVNATIGAMQASIDIIWEDAKLDANKKVTRPDPPPPVDW